jgi:hypothetical protein
MTFDEVLAAVLDLLQRDKRLSYRALKMRFTLDDDQIEALKEELIFAKQLAMDKDSRALVWTGGAASASPPAATPEQTQERSPSPTHPGIQDHTFFDKVTP